MRHVIPRYNEAQDDDEMRQDCTVRTIIKTMCNDLASEVFI